MTDCLMTSPTQVPQPGYPVLLPPSLHPEFQCYPRSCLHQQGPFVSLIWANQFLDHRFSPPYLPRRGSWDEDPGNLLTE